MKLKQLFLSLCLLASLKQYSNTDKYRLILLDNPATTITIGWNQISGDNPVVYYDIVDHGVDFSLYKNSKSIDKSLSFRGMNNRFSSLNNLLPNTNYYFIIKDSESTSKRFWFRTAPEDNSRLSFIAGGDSRNNREPRLKANTLVSKLKPHAVFFGGDMTNRDSDSEWQNWFDDWQLTTSADGRMIPIVPARGNHENPDVIYKLFNTFNESSYYALTFGKDLLRTYTLNSEISVLGNQLTWLKDDLATAPKTTWKMAQYHKPMRPHTDGKSEGNNQYNAWAQLFYDNQVNLVIDCDSHLSKTTWPVKPSSEPGNDEGFVIDQVNGTVYSGEGSWGAPLRPTNDDKSWTRNSGSFNQFKLIFVSENEILLRTIKVDNAYDVAELSNDNPFVLPENLDVFSPKTGAVVTISNVSDNNCPVAGTICDDNNVDTVQDEEDGLCNCVGLPLEKLKENLILVDNSTDDAEENLVSNEVDVTSSDLEFVYDGEKQVVGIRFNNINILANAELYRSYIQFQADEVDVELTNIIVQGELNVNSSTFEETSKNISSRTLTANKIKWNKIAPWNEKDEKKLMQRTPYLNSIINEIKALEGWEPGNSITFIFSGEGKRVAKSFDGSASPSLKLFYKDPCLPSGASCDDGDGDTFNDIEDGDCGCKGILEKGTLNYQVSTSEDDVEEAETGGAVYMDSSDLELVYDSFSDQFNQTVGIRFNKIALPKSALIVNAYLQFTADESQDEETNLLITGEKVANSVVFTDADFNVSSRTKTDAVVKWNAIPAWTKGDSGEAQRTPDLKSIIQEIVNQEDWKVLNSISFFINGKGKRTAESFRDAPAAPKLIIEYDAKNVLSTAEFLLDETTVSFYPNPAKDFLKVKGLEEITKIVIYNLVGQEMIRVSPNKKNFTLDISSLNSGLYILKFKKRGKSEKSVKIQVK